MDFWSGRRTYITPFELGALIQGEKRRMGGVVVSAYKHGRSDEANKIENIIGTEPLVKPEPPQPFTAYPHEETIGEMMVPDGGITSRIKVEELAPEPKSVLSKLSDAVLSVWSAPPPPTPYVESPMKKAIVKGTSFNISAEWERMYQRLKHRKDPYGFIIHIPSLVSKYTSSVISEAAITIRGYCNQNDTNLFINNAPSGTNKIIADKIRTKVRKEEVMHTSDIQTILEMWGLRTLKFGNGTITIKGKINSMTIYIVYEDTPHYTLS
jgi:hypothetical protein